MDRPLERRQGQGGDESIASDFIEPMPRFAASPKCCGLVVGDISGINKKGWEYPPVRQEDVEDASTKMIVKRSTVGCRGDRPSPTLPTRHRNCADHLERSTRSVPLHGCRRRSRREVREARTGVNQCVSAFSLDSLAMPAIFLSRLFLEDKE